MPNRISALMEEQILINTRKNPTIGCTRLADKMSSDKIEVTPTMVRYVWQRHGLSTRLARLEWTKSFNTISPESSDKPYEPGSVQQSIP